MAEDDDEDSTPDLLSLNQAVALIVERLPPHDVDAVQKAIDNALINGRLRDCLVVGDGFDQTGSTAPDTWRRWLDEDRVNHRTGEVYFPPRPFCPACAAREVSVFAASGMGRLYSYVIHHRPVPGFTPPYAIAVVELDEGPRMMTNITGCPQTPEALELDMPV